jgi:serine/threonine protein kinase
MEWDHLIGQQLGQYELHADLGKGTYAHTYLAFQPRLRRHVAIKALHVDTRQQPDFMQRFEQIAQAIAQLNHPNIVSIYDFGEEQGLPYIVMQSVTGGTLKARLGKPMTVGEAVTPIIQMARALHHAHQRNVLHLDVRPANILIDQENDSHLLLTDFSLSQLFQAEHLTRTSLPIGAPAYLAPEQIEGRQVTARTDIYSLGALLFEALAGQPPFSGASATIILSKHLHEPPPYIRGFNPAVPRELAHVVAQALAKRPEERFASAEEFARALEPYRDAKERHYQLHLALDDLILDDDEDPDDVSNKPSAGAPPYAPGHSQPDTQAPEQRQPRRAFESEFGNQNYEFKALPALPDPDSIVLDRDSLVQSIGATMLRLARRLVGKTEMGQRIERLLSMPRAQGITGIASIAFVLLLSLSFALLVAAAPASGNPAGIGAQVFPPTPAATGTPPPTVTATTLSAPTATPNSPIIDPQAATALTGISAARSTDPNCQSNPNGATLPASSKFYITLCFDPGVIRAGGTAGIALVPEGTRASSVQKSQHVSGGSTYSWFQVGMLAPGRYTVEAFWNGKLGRISLLTLT